MGATRGPRPANAGSPLHSNRGGCRDRRWVTDRTAQPTTEEVLLTSSRPTGHVTGTPDKDDDIAHG